MSYNQIYAIALEGMTAEKMRVDVVANNIANQHTLLNADGTGFTPLQVMTTPKPFEAYLDHLEGGGIDSIEFIPEQLPLNKVYQPGHPSADKKGYLSYPGISTVDEMITLLRASRAFEANVKIMNTAHSLFMQALTIGEER